MTLTVLFCKIFCRYLKAAGFSLTPYLESFTPTFGQGTPVFPRISSNLHCGTPTFSKRCLWDSYFQNPSENPELVAKLTNLVAKAGSQKKKNILLPLNLVIVRFMTKQNSIRPKALRRPLTLWHCV